MVIGIISIIAGIFVFFQSSSLFRLSVLVNTLSGLAFVFVVVAVSLLLSGIFAIIDGARHTRTFLLPCALINLLAAVAALFYNAGDLMIWRFVCLGFSIYYFVRYRISKKKQSQDVERSREEYFAKIRAAEAEQAQRMNTRL